MRAKNVVGIDVEDVQWTQLFPPIVLLANISVGCTFKCEFNLPNHILPCKLGWVQLLD